MIWFANQKQLVENAWNKKILEKYNEAPKTWGVKLLVALCVVVLIAWSQTSVSFQIIENGSGIAGNIIKGIFSQLLMQIVRNRQEV